MAEISYLRSSPEAIVKTDKAHVCQGFSAVRDMSAARGLCIAVLIAVRFVIVLQSASTFLIIAT